MSTRTVAAVLPRFLGRPLRLCAFSALLLILSATDSEAQCPSGHRAVLEGSGSMPGGTIRQVLHMRKIDSAGYDGQWIVFRFEQYVTLSVPHPQTVTQTLQDKASDGSPINTVIQMMGNETRVVMEGKIALLIAESGRIRHHQGGVAEGQISGSQATIRWLPAPNPLLSGLITSVPDPILRVSPDTDFHAAGPHSENKFKPGAVSYSLTNCDEKPISYSVSSTAKWLKISPAEGVIQSNGSAAVSISLNGDFTAWDEGTYREPIHFTNVSTGRGNTIRHAELGIKPHRWHVSLRGHEIDVKDPYWKITTRRRLDMRFDYSFQGAFEIGKKKGKWQYRNGRVIAADVKVTPIVVPLDLWNFKPPACTNCAFVNGLVGKQVMGILHPLGSNTASAVQLNWGTFFPKARMWVQLKPSVACSPMPECSQAYQGSQIDYGSDQFHDRISAPEVPLKNGPHPYDPLKGAEGLRFEYTLKRLE